MSTESAVEDDPIGLAQADSVFSRLPEWVNDTLSAEQKDAIQHAIAQQAWRKHTIDIRLSLPVLGHRFYLTVVGGEEKRDVERLRQQRHHYPLRTLANIFFFLGIATVFYVVALVGVAMHSAIIEF